MLKSEGGGHELSRLTLMANQDEQEEHGCSGDAAALLSRRMRHKRWEDAKSSVNSSPLNKVLAMG